MSTSAGTPRGRRGAARRVGSDARDRAGGRSGSGPKAGESDGAIARVQVATNRGVFMISVAAELANMHPQTLRIYEARGLIEPRRSPKGTRLYSQEDVERLRRIQEMTAELGLNLAGVERVLDLEGEIERMHARIEELELEALHAQVRLAEQLEEVRRSFRAELAVPYRGGELVRLADVRSLFGRPRRSGDGS
jgi:MerR family transcriptional regulator/heat shock protein HspR